MGEQKAEITKGHDKYVRYLDCVDGFMGIFMSKLIKLCAAYCLISYTPIKELKKKKKT